MTMLTTSAAPSTASATSESAKLVETPKTTVASAEHQHARGTGVGPTRRSSG